MTLTLIDAIVAVGVGAVPTIRSGYTFATIDNTIADPELAEAYRIVLSATDDQIHNALTKPADTCWDEAAHELVHKGYTPTERTWTEHEGTAEITWRVWICECAEHQLDIREKVT